MAYYTLSRYADATVDCRPCGSDSVRIIDGLFGDVQIQIRGHPAQ
ncbi:hypothetical protein [uncultured Lamprocystis sp.]|jgi:hypothetical protein|nr:hypothetical protein [uncultured Lamprocystis sp.]